MVDSCTRCFAARPLLALYDGPLIGMPMGKEIPNSKTLAKTYRMFIASDRLAELFEEAREKEGEGERRAKVPGNLLDQVRDWLKQRPDMAWHRAVQLVVDPSKAGDEDERDDEVSD